MRPDAPRPLIAGPSTPSPPFPLRLTGPIVKGFGRGSSELGIPTANIPIAGLSVGGNENVESGVYYGWAGVDVDEEGKSCRNGDGEGDEIDGEREPNGDAKVKAKGNVWPMVMSIGWNPYYKNTKRSVVCPAFPLTSRRHHYSINPPNRKSTSCTTSRTTSMAHR